MKQKTFNYRQMGNSNEGERKKRIASSRFMPKIYEYMTNRGKITGEALRQWMDNTCADNIYSVTYTKVASPSNRTNKQEMIATFEKAYEGKWRSTLLEILDVRSTADSEVIKFRWINDFPHAAKPGTRAKMYFETEATFDKTTGLWIQSIHNQYIPEPPQPSIAAKIASGLCSVLKAYGEEVSNNLDTNMKTLDRLNTAMGSGGGYYSSNSDYDSSKQHRENMARQANDWNNYQRQQQQQAEQRLREAQQALAKRNNY